MKLNTKPREMKYTTGLNQEQSETEYVYIFIGESRYRVRESEDRLSIQKMNHVDGNNMNVHPQSSNTIDID